MKQLVSFLCCFFLLLPFLAPAVFAADTDIVINEFQVEPSGSSQWVELYNKGNEAVDITGWVIDDSGGSTNFTIPPGSLNSHQCLSFQSSAFHLNTATSDTVQILHNGTVIDSHPYERSPGVNMSWGRAPDGGDTWMTFSVPTQDGLNADGTICSSPTPTPTPTPSKTPTPTKVPTPTKTPKPTKTSTPSKTSFPSSSASDLTKTNLLGSTTSRPTPTPDYNVPTAVIKKQTEENERYIAPTESEERVKTQGIAGINLSFVFMGLGAAMIGVCGVLMYLRYRKSQEGV